MMILHSLILSPDSLLLIITVTIAILEVLMLLQNLVLLDFVLLDLVLKVWRLEMSVWIRGLIVIIIDFCIVQSRCVIVLLIALMIIIKITISML